MELETTMANLIPLEQAAKMLGVSEEKLTEMRSSQQVSAVKSGSDWKFKRQELERVASELGTTLDDSVADDDLAFGSSSLELAGGEGGRHLPTCWMMMKSKLMAVLQILGNW